MPTDPPDLMIRPAGHADLQAIAEVYLEARQAAVPAMPPPVHTVEEIRAHIGGWDLTAKQVWLAEVAADVVGFAALSADWLDDLYLRPEYAGQGIGSAILDLVKAQRPAGFSLWVFESNEPARRFYRRHGLIELDHTDGHDNEEHAPDVRMAWPGHDPLGFMRAQIDDVDTDLAHVLARRFALTAAIQPLKPISGHAGRDPAREREIALRMAHLTGLPVEGLQQIVHAVIVESLTAYETGHVRNT